MTGPSGRETHEGEVTGHYVSGTYCMSQHLLQITARVDPAAVLCSSGLGRMALGRGSYNGGMS